MNDAQTTSPQGTGNPLKQLESFGQSAWLDFIRRGYIADGSLGGLVQADALKGVTSNPAIFEKAMTGGKEYDDQFKALAARDDLDAVGVYEAMAVEDIRRAADALHPVFEATGGIDGYVSLEVSPYLALDTEATIAEARRLWAWVDRPNLMIKVPGTEAGTPAIQALIADGININVTLLFSIEAYQAVAEAYLAGLEARAARGEAVSGIASVASFFISRIDTAIDKAIDARLAAAPGADEADLRRVRGKVAIANAKLAYQWYLELSQSPRWQALKAKGAQPQRLLWASTGTKDPAYSDVLYVEELIGPETVNTLPPATMDAFRDHGSPRASLTEDIAAARDVIATADRLGLDLPGVTRKLVEEGVLLFVDAFDKLLGAVAAKRAALLGTNLASVTLKLPADLAGAVSASLEDWRRGGKIRRLWARDAALWTGADEANWLAWLDVADERLAHVEELERFQQEVAAGGFSHVLLLGMGGSSLGPEVLAHTFGKRGGYPELLVLDSTDPQQVATFESRVDLAKTLVIVASKSGGTLEPNILSAYFLDRMRQTVGAEQAPRHFVAITDPGSKLQALAEREGYRAIFLGNPAIGGRYSVLSNFGLVPAAAAGINLRGFLESALRMVRATSAGTPPEQNPGVQLGTLLGVAGLQGRDKVTLIASPGIAGLGAWLEQLIAESTGKHGKGLILVDNGRLAAPGLYGADRVFAYLRLNDRPDTSQDAAVAALEAAGHPVVHIGINGHQEIGQQFFLWEIATAIASSLLGVNPFDQPDVEASKIKTRELASAYAATGQLPAEAPFATFDGAQLFADAANAQVLAGDSLEAVLRAHLARAVAGDYVALLAYIEQNAAHTEVLQQIRAAIRDKTHVASCAEFGPRFLHSTGQAYKGGPARGVFLQITADDARDLPVPGETYTFGIIKAAQARGDFDVLAERGRRALRVHLTGDLEAGLGRLRDAVLAALD